MKKARPRSQLRPFELVDEALNACTHIATLAELLECVGTELNPHTIASTGRLVSDEANKLHELLAEFERRLPKRHRTG